MKGNNQVILEKRKSPTPLLKLEILEACQTESGSTFHESTILLKKLNLKVSVLAKFFFNVSSSLPLKEYLSESE